MSNADEILKLKELLDDNIITKEEFENKKKELLKSQPIKKEIVQNNNNATINNQKSPIKAIFIGIIIFVVILTVAILNAPTLEKQLQNEVGLTREDALKVRDILNDCGISYGTITRNEALDTQNGKAYNISIDSDSTIVAMKIQKNKIYSLRLIKMNNKDINSDKILYKENKKVSSLSDYNNTGKIVYNYTETIQNTILSLYPNASFSILDYSTWEVSGETYEKNSFTYTNIFNQKVESTYLARCILGEVVYLKIDDTTIIQNTDREIELLDKYNNQ